MRAERLLRIVMLLQTRGRVTAAVLARELEVSTRTIQRDMEALSRTGIPVYATRGGAGGWALVEEYRTSLTALTTSDALAIVVGRARGILSDLGLDDPGEGPILKLMSAIAPTAREQVEHARRRIHVDPGPWGAVAAPDPSLLRLQRAIWDDQLVRIRYGTAPGSFLVAPLGLVRQNTNWYLVARRGPSRSEPAVTTADPTDPTGPAARYRTYRVSRIQEVAETDRAFDRPDDFDLAAHWRAASTDFVDTRPSYVATLRLRGAALARARWVYARRKTISEPNADGWAEAELDLGDFENAQAGIRLLGNDVIIDEPDELRRATVEAAQEFVAANGRPRRAISRRRRDGDDVVGLAGADRVE